MKQYKNTVNTSTHIAITLTRNNTHTYTHHILQNKLKQPHTGFIILWDLDLKLGLLPSSKMPHPPLPQPPG
jgi:hypothetical protein